MMQSLLAWWSDSVGAALISGGFLVLGAFMTIIAKRSEKRGDQMAVSLAAQLSGWDNYAKNLRGRLADLEIDNERCQKRVNDLLVRLTASEAKCDVLDDDVRTLRREVIQLKDLRGSPT